MNPVARARHVLARRPWLYWSAVLVLAAAAGGAVTAAAAGVDEARQAGGPTPDLLVATVDIAPGDELAPRTEVRARPLPVVPDATIGSLPPGATARQHVAAGEALVTVDVVPAPGPQALIPAGSAAVAVAEAVPSGAAVGDHVVAAAGGVVLTDAGVVVGLTADALLVAVPIDEAALVAQAATSGELVLLLVP
ncbi:MAG: hypothetical protein ABW195_10450 [Ilumatobacteraceae bacterium]